MVGICSGTSFRSQLRSDAVSLEVEVLAAVRICDECLHAAVFPYGTVVLHSRSAHMVFLNLEKHGDDLVRVCYVE